MKQVIQNLQHGQTEVMEVAAPAARAGCLLIQTRNSVISSGTERMLVDFGRANLLQKARSQPDKVRMVLDKIKTDGLLPTIEAVQSKLDQPLALGYANAGVVVEVGANVSGFCRGDRVVSNGPHAEIVCVPQNLCARIPESVPDEAAAFTVIASVALQGVRLAQPTLGECFVVTGLGLIGLIAVQLLRANGNRVLGIDFDSNRLRLAREFGAEVVDLSAGQDPVKVAETFSRQRGVDGVLITATSKSNEPIHQAALMSRKRARLVLVGTVGMELSRSDFYEKELTLQVSCSYGPGRYDTKFEEEGCDYPVGFVRWTEQRNFEAVLDMLGDGALDFNALIAQRYSIDDAAKAYDALSAGKAGLGIVLDYASPIVRNEHNVNDARTVQTGVTVVKTSNRPGVAIIGAGNYAIRSLLPILSRLPVTLKTVASSSGVSSSFAARKFGFQRSTTDVNVVLEDPAVEAVIITTRHDSHASLVSRALNCGKHVFVEKPLAIDQDGLKLVSESYHSLCADGRAPILAVGFNRRFAPQIKMVKSLVASFQDPLAINIMVNAGALPSEHWLNNPKVGGGRIIGEGCHFIDLARALVGHPISELSVTSLQPKRLPRDTVSISMRFSDGSIAILNYFSNGHPSFPKERIEVFSGGRILELNNFRQLRCFGWAGLRTKNLWRQDKGHVACLSAFVDAVRSGGPPAVPFSELIEVTNTALHAAEMLVARY